MRTLGVGVALALAGGIAAASVRGSALSPGGLERTDAWSIVFLSATVASFVLYVAALLVLRSRANSVRVACAFAVLIQALPLAGPLLLSRDAYSYWSYGRIVWNHQRDPYARAPARFPHDPATADVAPAWRSTTSVYGPAFTAASAGVAAVSGSSGKTAALIFRTLAALAVLAAAAFAGALARRRAFAIAFVGWNPLLAIDFGGGGHNDAWMIAALLGSLVLLERGRDVAGGALWILAAAIKGPALLLLTPRMVRSSRAAAVGGIAAAVAIASAATVVFGAKWLSALGVLGSREAAFSIPSRLAAAGLGEGAALTLARVVLVVGGLWLLFEAARGRSRLALGACLLLVTSPWILPWYAIWPLGLAAGEDDPFAQVAALCLAAYLLPDRVPI